MINAGLYVHIPFCASKCKYCAFTSSTQSQDVQKQYFQALWQEIDSCKNHPKIQTIFFGGGTPSVVDADLVCKTLELLFQKFQVSKSAEISLEANPNTVTFDSLQKYRKAGFNRISFGVQSFDQKTLQKLGRTHDVKDVFGAIENARNAGFENINIDIILGAEKLGFEIFEASVQKAKSFGVKHISVYMLQLEKDTPLCKEVQASKTKVLCDDDTALEFEFVQKTLKRLGFLQYEISNFAQKSFECKHNQNYWSGGMYLAFGISACSFWQSSRTTNVATLKEYIASPCSTNNFVVEHLSAKEQIEEYIMLSLRRVDGLDAKKLFAKFGYDILQKKHDVIERLKNKKFLVQQGNILYIPTQKFAVSNAIIVELF